MCVYAAVDVGRSMRTSGCVHVRGCERFSEYVCELMCMFAYARLYVSAAAVCVSGCRCACVSSGFRCVETGVWVWVWVFGRVGV